MANSKIPPKENKMSTFVKRAYMTIVMLLLLTLVMKYRYLLLFSVFILKMVAYREVTNILKERSREYSSIILSWYLIIISDIALWRSRITQILKVSGFPELRIFNSNLMSFTLYLIAIVYFISSLRKGTLRNQALHFVLAHFGILMINYPAFCVCKNIVIDKYWFIFPVLLVVSNDVFAYLVGKSFGRTPLIAISPNKTVEGFLGGFVFTLITGVICTYLKINTGVFDSHPGSDIAMNSKEIFMIRSSFYDIPKIWIHTAVFILFSSFCAPFGGLLASTTKRIFRIKDFADYLPGHGGITDRIDCHLLMGIFTQFYIASFVYRGKSSPQDVVNRIIKRYNSTEITEIAIGLLQHITV